VNNDDSIAVEIWTQNSQRLRKQVLPEVIWVELVATQHVGECTLPLRVLTVQCATLLNRYGPLRKRYGAVLERYRTVTENIDVAHH